MTLSLDRVLSVLLLLLFSFNFNHQTGELCCFSSFFSSSPPPPTELRVTTKGSHITQEGLQIRWASSQVWCVHWHKAADKIEHPLLEWRVTLGLWWNSIGHTLLRLVSCWTPAHNLSPKPETGSTSRLPTCRCSCQSRLPMIEHQCEHNGQHNSVSQKVARGQRDHSKWHNSVSHKGSS